MDSQSRRKLTVFHMGWIAILLLRLFPIGGVWDSVHNTTFIVLFFWIAIYTSSWILFSRIASNRSEVRHPPKQNKIQNEQRILWLALISCAGAMLLVYDFAFIRGYGFNTAVSDIRILEVEAAMNGRQGSFVSGIGRLTIPAIIAAWIFNNWQFEPRAIVTRLVLYLSTIIIVFAQATYEGGRLFLACLVLASLFAAGAKKSLKSKELKIRSSKNLKLYIAIFLALVFSVWVFLDRGTNNNRLLEDAYTVFGASFPMTLNSDIILPNGGIFGAAKFVLMMFWVYITHPINELDILLQQENLIHAVGNYQFPQIWAILSQTFGLQSGFTVFQLSTVGVYVTTFGGWYIDFGYTGAFTAAIIVGGFTGFSTTKFYQHEAGAVAMSAPIMVVLAVFAPIHSVITTVWPTLFFIWFFAYNSKPLAVRTQAHQIGLNVRK
jgi:hypothetical protein